MSQHTEATNPDHVVEGRQWLDNMADRNAKFDSNIYKSSRRVEESKHGHHDRESHFSGLRDHRGCRHSAEYRRPRSKRRLQHDLREHHKTAHVRSGSLTVEDCNSEREEGEWVSDGSDSENDESAGSDESEIIGPMLPPTLLSDSGGSRPARGPTLPSLDDVQTQNAELYDESIRQIRADRKQRGVQFQETVTGALGNLIHGGGEDSGRAGDNRMEKRKLENESRREYIRARSPGGMDEIEDDELMEGTTGSTQINKLSEIAQRKAEKERLKRERREAIYRERDAERRKRWDAMELREKKTVEMLRELARQRFGEGISDTDRMLGEDV
ncbi:uncharacterized protein V1518DRAFT_409518 [Limtongia smithiae]|uniref:uncharacterized protein n=1 Tax=Limtongia smithiae TaxID=1125753 RepID=UPI0034CD141F